MSQHALFSVGCNAWRSITCPRSELRLDLTLGCGQTFRWRETADGHWTGVMRGKVWTLTQTEDMLWYYVYSHQKNPGTENRQKQKVEEKEQLLVKRSKRMIDMKQEEVGMCTVMSETDNKDEDLLRDYFQLDVKLGDLYRNWSTADPHFKHTANIFTGVRLLRQDPVECLFSFICSSNNHISRIQGMVDRLCQTLGTLLCKLDDVAYHDFPPLQDLTVEDRIHHAGMDGLLRNCATGCRVDEAFTMDDLVDSISADTSGLRCGHVQAALWSCPVEDRIHHAGMDGLLRNCATGCRVDEAFTMDDLVDSISADTSGLRCGHVQLRIVFITPVWTVC
ncbi:N-glycosylase/DNA lyase [Anabarilius grahami]|uniref:N-glycosylase/DNA lyase n=1 Tax=Anabarilius grahami TaxID=495550 RepID=A0A3N0XW92_ANAGA|nr:N-glycosylase/DNA lyase [Anabarilius grahami]